MTIYNRDGIKAEIDETDVVIYVESAPVLRLTMDDLMSIAYAACDIKPAKDREYDV